MKYELAQIWFKPAKYKYKVRLTTGWTPHNFEIKINDEWKPIEDWRVRKFIDPKADWAKAHNDKYAEVVEWLIHNPIRDEYALKTFFDNIGI
ncbi:TPA: hypothetical protein RI779_003487 [Vibrio cholerae]|nr:hypothetical protein [Vibrio cholerae]HDV5512564.1 hypothetical protein [Vibrio cholerae]HDV5549618.1 hypothetical protein [Vibrio cholerae]